MPAYFIDTWLWIALLDEKRQEHETAEAIIDDIMAGTDLIYTSEMVFTELLAWFSKRGAKLRAVVVEIIEEIRFESRITVLDQTHMQFERALARYKMYQDKEWSLTDCASMIAMADHNIPCAITNDHHFAQAQFMIRNS